VARREPKAVSSRSVGYAYSFTSFDGSVTSVPYPFRSQMAKVQLEKLSEKPHERANRLTIRRLIAT
jgi:hypothetical protein